MQFYIAILHSGSDVDPGESNWYCIVADLLLMYLEIILTGGGASEGVYP